MKLVLYLLKKIIPLFIGALVFVSLLLNLVDLFMHLATYLQNAAGFENIVRVMILYIPKTIWYGIPVAILFSTSFVLSEMYACNELEALFASGVSLLHFTFPVLVISAFLSLGLFIFEDNVVVQSFERKNELQQRLLGDEEAETNMDVIVISDSGRIIYQAKVYFEQTHYLMDACFIFRDLEKNLESIVFADGADWSEESSHWTLRNPVQYSKDGEIIKKVPFNYELSERLTENYKIFRKSMVDVASVTSEEAKVYINHLKKAGLPYQEPLSEYYKKYAFPMIVFLVVFLSIGLTGKTKKNVLLISLASSIGASVLFYVMMMITMVLAKHGYITPLMGAWFPVVLFTFLSFVLFKNART